MLPGPRLAALVFRERIDTRYQQAAFATRAQAHVDLIEASGGGMHRQQVHDPLREPHEENLVIDGPWPVRLLAFPARVVQEHQVEIGRIAELHAPELAVPHHADAHGPALGAFPTLGQAKLRADLAPAELDRMVDDDFGDFGEPVAHPHDGQSAGQVRDGDAEDRGPLKLAQGLDLALRILVVQLLEARAHFGLEIGAVGQLREQSLIDELVQQQRVRGNLPCQKVPVAADFDEPPARGGVLLQQRKVSRALADRLDDTQQPPQHL